MAYGDIHNSSGTICKAQSDATCPLSTDGGHSKDIDSYVDYQVENSGVDGDVVRGMIADGTPPADAVEVAKSGLSSTGSALSKEDEAYQNQNNEETYGFIQKLEGNERAKAVADTERILAGEYQEAKYEVDGDEEKAALDQWYRNSLAAIHGVSKDAVSARPDGTVELRGKGGTVSTYTSEFKPVSTYYPLDKSYEAYEDEINEDAYGHISKLQGSDRAYAVEEAERNLAQMYRSGKDEADGDDSELAKLNQVYKNSLAAVHGVSKSRVVTNAEGDIEVDRADGSVSVYSKNFEPKETIAGQSWPDADLKKNHDEVYGSELAGLSGESRKAKEGELEATLAGEYRQGRAEAESDEDETEVERARNIRVLNRYYRAGLGYIRGVNPDSLSEFRD